MTEVTQTASPSLPPRLPISRSNVAWFFEGLGLLGLAACLLLPALSWVQLPETIPHHFNLAGKPDGWGGKWVLWFLLLIAAVLYLGLSLISLIPHRINYPWISANAQNAAQQYKIMRSLLTLLKAEVVLLFAYIEWGVIRTALGKWDGLSPAFLPVALAIILGSVVGHLIAALRAR